MALSQADLDALDSAIASAELEVELDGRRVRYRSVADMLRARAHVAEVLTAAAQGPAGSRRRYRFAFATYREGSA